MVNSYNIRYQPTGLILPKRWLSKESCNITYGFQYVLFSKHNEVLTHSSMLVSLDNTIFIFRNIFIYCR